MVRNLELVFRWLTFDRILRRCMHHLEDGTSLGLLDRGDAPGVLLTAECNHTGDKACTVSKKYCAFL